MQVKKMNHANGAIKCVVNTCHYYLAGDHCAAEQIEVQHRNANSMEETDCATFTREG